MCASESSYAELNSRSVGPEQAVQLTATIQVLNSANPGHTGEILPGSARATEPNLSFPPPLMNPSSDPMMSSPRLDTIREGVLDEMERSARRFRALLIGAALGESLLMALAVVLTDWKDPVQRLIFVTAIGTWTLLAIGLVVLAHYVTSGLARLAAASSADG
jgi:hypothetical protein